MGTADPDKLRPLVRELTSGMDRATVAKLLDGTVLQHAELHELRAILGTASPLLGPKEVTHPRRPLQAMSNRNQTDGYASPMRCHLSLNRLLKP